MRTTYQTGDTVGLETFCMSRGASQPLRNTFICPAAHPVDDTIAHSKGPQTIVLNKKKQVKTGQN